MKKYKKHTFTSKENDFMVGDIFEHIRFGTCEVIKLYGDKIQVKRSGGLILILLKEFVFQGNLREVMRLVGPRELSFEQRSYLEAVIKSYGPVECSDRDTMNRILSENEYDEEAARMLNDNQRYFSNGTKYMIK